MQDEHDRFLRQAAFEHVGRLSQRFTDMVPLEALRAGFVFDGDRVSLGSFYSGIYRPKEMHGPAALALVTAPPKAGRPPPYEDTYDEATGTFTYRFRDASSDTPRALAQAEADNRGLVEAHRLLLPLIYFRGIAPGQYLPLAPFFVVSVDGRARTARLEAGVPVFDTAGLVSDANARRYATHQAAYRLHQQRFRHAVLRAYRTSCAICRLKEAVLLQAAHIIQDRDLGGDATVVNGLALCAIHHLAYDRNLLGIDPDGVVHIQTRLLEQIDGPMLANGLQHFHEERIHLPSRREDWPDPDRLARRFEQFGDAA